MNINYPLIIKNKNFQNVEIKNYKDKEDFINWYIYVNKEFKLPQKNDRIINSFFINKDKSTKIIKLPDFIINSDKELNSFIISNHGKFKNLVIEILDDFNISYWDKLISIISDKNFHIDNINYTEILISLFNNEDILLNKKEEIKSIIENIIDLIKQNKIKYAADILAFVGNLIFYKEEYGNNWIIEKIDTLILSTSKNETKMFVYNLEKISKDLHHLDFTNVKINKDFKKLIKGNSVLQRTPSICYPFYFELNMQKYANKEKIVYQILMSNVICVTQLIRTFLENNLDVITSSVNIEKSIVKIIAITDNIKIKEQLEYFIDLLMNKSKENFVISNKDFEKEMINYCLRDDLKINDTKINKVKKI